MFTRFKALVAEPMARVYGERHDNLEAIYNKLQERRDLSDVTSVVKELHRIVNEAIRAAAPGEDQRESKLFDLSQIDLEKLRDEFARKCNRKAAALEDVRKVVEDKLVRMMARNPQRMDYYKKYSDIVADYNREKDRVTVEDTFARLLDLARSLDEEQRRATEEGLSEDELALFDLLMKDSISKADRERVKQASRSLLQSIEDIVSRLERWTEKEQTQAEVETFILDQLFLALPTPPFTDEDKQAAAERVYQHIWQRSVGGGPLAA